jgi:PTH1 family peptidyl-tRNA hydrolase
VLDLGCIFCNQKMRPRSNTSWRLPSSDGFAIGRLHRFCVLAGLPLKLIVGLGNPGREYARTRHNAGWWFVDELAAQSHGSWRHEARQHTDLARVTIADTELWLLKPTAFMNRSGAPVAAVANYYGIAAADILVVHDDIDLPPGTARLKQGGGHAGHNGLRDVIAHIGADFWRLRLGVGHPGSKELVLDAVLDRPTPAEQQAIDEAMTRALEIMPELLRSGAQNAMLSLHSRNAGDSESEGT